MGSRNRRTAVGALTVGALTVPLAAVTGPAVVTLAVVALVVAQTTPAAAGSTAAAGSSGTPRASAASKPQGLLPGILPSLPLPTALPSILPTALPTALPSILPTALPSLPLPTPSLPSLPGLLLPSASASPPGTGATQPATTPPAPGASAGSSPGRAPGRAPGGASGGAGAGRSGGRSATGSATGSAAPGIPVPFSPNAAPPTVSLLPANAVGYALPVPASVVAADPGLIGEGASVSRRAGLAGPVTIPVAAGTEVDAVTAGTARAIPASNGTSAIVLSGADGATYTYRNVVASLPATPASGARAARVAAGTRIGMSGPGGLTFSISVPDVRGVVDADEAMQAWASGLSPDVRSLPSSVASSVAAPARDQVLLVTAAGGSATAGSLAKTLAGPLVQVRGAADGGGADRRIAASGAPKLTVADLPDGTPAQAARLAALLPPGHQLLWVAPPATTPKQANAYRAIVAARPGFRVESLPAALARPKTGSAPARELATATLIAAYASTAYRLHSASSQADSVLSWAEARLGQRGSGPGPDASAGSGGFSGPDGFGGSDGSGLAMDALAQAGIAIPRGAAAQWRQTRGRPVPESRLAPGDLVFSRASGGTDRVGIYAGDGEIIDAPSSGPVRFDPLSGLTGYTGSTDPFTPVPESALASGIGSWLTAPVAALAVPGALGQYQDFARRLTDTTWGPGQFPYLYALWERESGWNPAALNPVSGAFGIPQSLPAVKMAAAGPDWASNAYTQIIWGLGYISAAYGTPQRAWSHELTYGWY